MEKNWFRRCDFLNVPISLSYQKEYFYATTIGAFLTLFCFLIIISLAIYEIRTLYEKSSFTVITNEYSDPNQEIDFTEMPLLFNIVNDEGDLIEMDERLIELKGYIIELEVLQENGVKKKNIKTSRLDLEYCHKVLNNQSEFYSFVNLSRYKCVKSGYNLTSYGIQGDMNNGFKGFRIYLNKCSGKANCYNESIIKNRLQNAKFVVTYLGLNTNIYNQNAGDFKYQLFSKSCSLSTNFLKKIYFTYNVGRFYIIDNILFNHKTTYNYISGNSFLLDFDLDPSSSITKDSNSLGYVGFHYSGNVIEITKQIKSFLDTISIIGNTFNIVLTIFKMINGFYSNRILFSNIFHTLFFYKENLIVNPNHLKPSAKINNFMKKNNRKLDISDDLCLNNNNKQEKENKRYSHQLNLSAEPKIIKIKNNSKKNSEQEKYIKDKLFYFVLFPFCILKKNKSLQNLILIKDTVCTFFSVEKIYELISFKENNERKSINKMNSFNEYNSNNINNNTNKNWIKKLYINESFK